MFTLEQVERAREWMFTRPDSHHQDGYERLRRHMIVGGVDLPFRLTKEHTETEQHLWVVYFDALAEMVEPQQGGPEEMDRSAALLAHRAA